MPQRRQKPKPVETPFKRFEGLMKKLVKVPKEEVDRATPKKKRPKSR